MTGDGVPAARRDVAAAAAQPAEAERAAPPAVGTPAPPDTASVADGVERRLDPRVVPLGRWVGWVTLGVFSPLLLSALAVASWVVPLPRWAAAVGALAWGGVLLGLAWLAHRWPAVKYRHASYTVDVQGIEIRRGVVWREVLNVPRSRVQHTDVSQGPLERGYGLGTLVIYTAGTGYARVELGGLDHGVALSIRDHLLPREGGDAV